MKTYIHRWLTISTMIPILLLGAATSEVWAKGRDRNEPGVVNISERSKPVIPVKDARLKIELNATDQDAGVQVFIDADPWKTMNIYDPGGRMIFSAANRGKMAKQGGTELFLESGEPSLSEVPLAEFLRRLPKGNYRIVGKGLKGEKFVGIATFTHNIPAGPVLVAPMENSLVDPNDTVVMWQPVAAPNGSPIIGYQVLVVKPNSGLPAIPKIILDVMMPPTANSMAVPQGFLLPNSEYEWEVLAIEKGGNQTLSVGHFRTPL